MAKPVASVASVLDALRAKLRQQNEAKTMGTDTNESNDGVVPAQPMTGLSSLKRVLGKGTVESFEAAQVEPGPELELSEVVHDREPTVEEREEWKRMDEANEFQPDMIADVTREIMMDGEPTLEEIEAIRQMEFDVMENAVELPRENDNDSNPYSNILLGGKAISVRPGEQAVLKTMHEQFNQSVVESKPRWVSSFTFARKSLTNMEDVYPPLVFLASQALQLSRVDFACVTGALSDEQQEWLVQRGVSRTRYSPHQRNDSGYSMAVELVPFINGRLNYNRQSIYQIVAAMYDASVRSLCPEKIRWHGALDMRLDDFGDSPEEFTANINLIVERHTDADSLDATRFEWVL